MGKMQPRGRAPLPRGRDDNDEFMKIILEDPNGAAEELLNLQACYTLLNLKSSANLKTNQSACLTLAQLMQGGALIYDAS